MPETREEAVRRIVTLSCTGREKYGLAFDAGEKFGREAALREATEICEVTAKEVGGAFWQTHRLNVGLLEAWKSIKALIPVAEKEEKA